MGVAKEEDEAGPTAVAKEENKARDVIMAK